MSAAFLAATSFVALLGAQEQGLDVADAGRTDSARAQVRASLVAVAVAKPMPTVAATRRASRSTERVKAVAVPMAAVPLPKPPLWSTPAASVPLPSAAPWPLNLPGDFLADSIVVEKAERRMTLYYRGVPVRRYRVALGKNPVGDKVSIGDYRTPEGVYWIVGRNPMSKFYKSLEISYPDSAHEARAAALGLNPGGNIMIHGLPSHQATLGSKHILADWTEGCIAVTNEEIDELWRAVEPWSAIQIKP